ncbi:MAG: hypothetical protein SGI92_08495 [Bryobacteraceae bacterium]|nr:hypothetical protein [Bryobacteraceae bacterium]
MGNRIREKAEKRRLEFLPATRVDASLPELLRVERPDLVDILSAPKADWDAAQRIAAGLKAAAVHENHRCRPWFRQAFDAQSGGQLGKLRFLNIEHCNATSPAEACKSTSETGVWLESSGSQLVDSVVSTEGSLLAIGDEGEAWFEGTLTPGKPEMLDQRRNAWVPCAGREKLCKPRRYTWPRCEPFPQLTVRWRRRS